MIGFELDTSAVAQLADQLERVLEVRSGELGAATSLLVTRMIVRTSSGRDLEGRPFASYATSTQQDKARRGHSSVVSLSDTGVLLASVLYRIEDGRSVVYFSDARLATRAMWLHKGTAKMPARPWFGFSARELEGAVALIAERIAQRIGG